MSYFFNSYRFLLRSAGKHREQLHIRVVPLSVFADGKQYYNYLDGSAIGFKDFYTQLAAGKIENDKRR